jgi:hydroxymethylpyrimidine kinase / phosphomethylpyrimidine kinase / thiamine-phosphate diphosphorylase
MHLLSIAGSDSSSGAGIQGDLKTFNALKAYGLSVVTAITSQNTSMFFGTEPVSPLLVKSQLRSILKDFHIDAIKIGMVYDKQTIRVIHSELAKIKIPIILDPIFKSTTGGILQKESAFSDFKKFLIPLCYIITPNTIEAEKISGINIKSLKDMKNAAQKIQKIGAKNVIIKGGHFLKGVKVTDLLLDNKKFITFSHTRMKFESHGGGCTFSAALCANIASGKKLSDAVDSARLYTLESIRNASKIGQGLAITKPSEGDTIETQLSNAILEFCKIKSIYAYIPECQTNFVYSSSNPTTLKDIIGLEGRIVKTGNSVVVAGHLKYGGSRHVASAVLQMIQKFPSVRSGLNIKYDDKIIKKAISKGLKVSSYDRSKEPRVIREKEGNTMSWGIKVATTNLKTSPDIVFHKGGFGKEPMIIIFGKSPIDVLGKILMIVR